MSLSHTYRCGGYLPIWFFALFVASLWGCAEEGTTEERIEGRVSAFRLVDQNPTSSRFSQEVSPRDYVGRVSVWYFGHST